MTATAKVCPLCGDTGWKTVGEGSARRVTRCDCRRRDRGQRLLEQARIPRRYQDRDLSNFHVLNGPSEASLSRALIAAQGFVQNYPMSKAGLLLVGPVGVGKTHLAVGIIRELTLTKGIPCLFYDYRELLKEIQNSYNPSVPATEAQILRPVFDTDILVLDELGAVRTTEWVWDAVSHIINNRYNNERTTIFTTNFEDAPALENTGEPVDVFALRRAGTKDTLGDRIGERMRSRLHEMCRSVKMEGEDFRTKFRSANLR